MFDNNFMIELNKDKKFYPVLDDVGLYQKHGLFFLTNTKGYSLPFSGPITYKHYLRELSNLKESEEFALEFQFYLNENFEHLVLNHVASILERISPYMNRIFFSSAIDFYAKTERLLKTEYSNDLVVDILNLIYDIDFYQNRFVFLFDLLAPDSSTPTTSFLEPLILLLKRKMRKNEFQDIDNFFDLFWDFIEKQNKEVYTLEFIFEEKEQSYEVKSIKDFVDVYFKILNL